MSDPTLDRVLEAESLWLSNPAADTFVLWKQARQQLTPRAELDYIERLGVVGLSLLRRFADGTAQAVETFDLGAVVALFVRVVVGNAVLSTIDQVAPAMIEAAREQDTSLGRETPTLQVSQLVLPWTDHQGVGNEGEGAAGNGRGL